MHTSATECAGMGRYWQPTFKARWHQAMAAPSASSAATPPTHSSRINMAQYGMLLRS